MSYIFDNTNGSLTPTNYYKQLFYLGNNESKRYNDRRHT